MGNRAVYLVGIDPPTNLLTQLTEVNRRLFRSFGIVSGLSFTPLIPVCALDELPDRPALSLMPRLPPLSTRQWKVVEADLFLSLDPEEPLRRIIDDIRSVLARSESQYPPIPSYPAIYLSRLDDPDPGEKWPESAEELSKPSVRGREEVITTLGPPPQLRWAGAALSCRRVLPAETKDRWRGTVNELCWAIRLRGDREED